MATLKLRVTGMTCPHCQMKVEKELMGAGGVYSAVVDLSAGEAEVDFNDDAATTDQLIASVAQAGYGAKVAGYGRSNASTRRRDPRRARWNGPSTPLGARGRAPPVCAPPPGSAWRGDRAPTHRADRC